MSLVVLSPHMDDAVLSFGAGMAASAAAGEPALAVTFFSGAPSEIPPGARAYHEACGLSDDAMAVRAREDDEAVTAVDATALRLGLYEALYRTDEDGRALYEGQAVFHPEAGPEPALVDELADAIHDLVERQAATTVLYPLGVGGHVDHLAVRDAAVRCQPGHPRVRWIAYEDVPYVMFPWCKGWADDAARAHAPVVQRAGEAAWAAKLDAIEHYSSQHRMLFERPDAWRDDITAYATSVGGDGPAERLWDPR